MLDDSTKEPTKKSKMGRKPYERTYEHEIIVELMLSLDTPHKYIAKKIGLSLNTFKKYYADEIEEGGAEAHFSVLNSLYHMAVHQNNVRAAIYYLDNFAGQAQKRMQQIVLPNENVDEINKLRKDLDKQNMRGY